ncbi:MAG: EamA family transporter [Verrucomicrobiota bacterium]
MQTLFWALASMGCAAANDFVFKLYARRGESVGAYMALIGVVVVLVFGACLPDRNCLLDRNTLPWGILCGIFSIIANILFVKALIKGDMGVCATIFRLNLVPAALLAFLLFKEPVTTSRLAAIASGVVAVVLFSWPAGKAVSKSFVSAAVVLIVLASLLRAGMGLCYKAGLLNGANGYGLITLNGVAWVIGGIICHFLIDRERWRVPPSIMAYGALSGVLVCGIVLFMMLALKCGDASLVLPVTQMSFALTALAGIVFIKEPLTSRKCMGIALAMVCILLMGVKR